MRKILSIKVKLIQNLGVLILMNHLIFCYLFTVCYGFHKYRTPHNIFMPANKQIANARYKKLLFFKYAVFHVDLRI